MIRTLCLFLLCYFGVSPLLPAQVQVQPQNGSDTATTWNVQILNADRYGSMRIDSATQLLIMAGHVKLKQDNTLFYCDSAVVNRNKKIVEAFGQVHINDNDSVDAYSQYLLYHMDSRIAYLNKNVKLTDSKSVLETQELTYDVNQKIGEYKNGGKVINGSSVLTSGEGTYYTDLKDAYFRRNVKLVDPKYQLSSDTLLYNTNTGIASFVALTHIRDSADRRITTREGYYDLRNRRAVLSKRSVVEDGPVRIIADQIDSNDSTGLNLLTGNAVYVDSAQGVSVLANYIEANRKESSFRATQRPLMIIRQDNDSIYVTADTLFSGRLSKLEALQEQQRLLQQKAADSLAALSDTAQARQAAPVPDTLAMLYADTSRQVVTLATDSLANDSTDRYFQAWNHVRIFSDSLQAVSDSLFYSGKDSVFRLFNDPIVWASGNQVTGDTIYLYTRNKKADRLYVAENGMAINKSADNLFNQVRGNRLYGYFVDGSIEKMQARGAAQSIYYVKDDNDYLVGVNKASGDIIELRFLNKELNRVVFISQVSGTLYPVNQLSEQESRLEHFQWLEDRRPKSRYELFGD